MRRWLLHFSFALLFVGSLAAKGRAPGVLVGNRPLEPAVMRVARAHDLIFRAYATVPHTDLRDLVFAAPGCARSVFVVVLSATFDAEAVVRAARARDYLLRYVYIDRVWDKPRPLAVAVDHAKYAALEMLGLTRYAPSPDLLAIEVPSQCRRAEAIDWRAVWNRNTLEAIESRQ